MRFTQLNRNSLLSEFVRCLVVNGYNIILTHRQPTHVELSCEWTDQFGCISRYLFIICDESTPSDQQLIHLNKIAKEQGQNAVVVSDKFHSSLSPVEFFEILGGTVPSWRALGPTYESVLLESSCNKKIKGNDNQPWKIFEDAIADGLEFVFGKRVQRLGGNKSGKRVSDMLAQLPDKTVIIIDAKASKKPFDASWKNLRALAEYTKHQVKKSKGIVQLGASFIVSSSFKQDNQRLFKIGNDFIAQTSIPLLFIVAEDLAHIIISLSKTPSLRNKIDWHNLVCRTGIFDKKSFDEEIQSLKVR